eukprot:349872-Chlamydomonas_euryale.AAC.4
MVRTRILMNFCPLSLVVSSTWSTTPDSALRSASDASRLVKRATVPSPGSGSETVLPTMMSSPLTRVPGAMSPSSS